MITKDILKKLASNLMFEMEEEEYDTLEKEFAIFLKQMDLIAHIKDVDGVEPMTFPFELDINDHFLRSDVANNEINFDDMKVNVKDYEET